MNDPPLFSVEGEISI